MPWTASDPSVQQHPRGENQHEEILSVSDLFLMPSETESFGLAALEAMACNISIVTSDIEVNKLILEKYKNKKLCKFDDVDCISKAVEELLICDKKDENQFKYTLQNRVEKIFQNMAVN